MANDKKTKLFYKEFVVWELLEYDVFRNWAKISKGDEVSLDVDNGAVLVKKGDEVFGVLPPDECKVIRMLLEMEHKNVFEGTVTCKNDSASYDNILKVAVYVKKN